MAGRAEEAGAQAPFDRVLAEAQAQERARLERYRVRWIVQHVVIIAGSVALIASVVPVLFDSNEGRGGGFAVAVFLTGGWLGFLALLGLAGIGLFAIPVALWRIVAVASTDDLAGYERSHDPWWSERPG